MDILKPQIISTNDGRRYRKPNFVSKGSGTSQERFDSQPMDFEGEEYASWEDEQPCEGELDALEKTDRGYTTSLKDIPSFYFKFICGKKNETKKRIEKQTATQITIPRPGCEGDIVITGKERSGVLSARTRVELTIESARKKQPATHFISVPLISNSTKERFEEFKKQVLDSCSSCRGLDTSIFQIPERLHITFGILVLMNDSEIQKAAKRLAELKEEIQRTYLSGSSSIQIKLEGVEYMNDDPAEVDVLYAKVKPTEQSQREDTSREESSVNMKILIGLKDLHAELLGLTVLDFSFRLSQSQGLEHTVRLQDLADFLVENFVSAGFMKQEHDRVKLHSTVMNTIFRESRDEEEATIKQTSGKRDSKDFRQGKSRTSFDARNIIEQFQRFQFGEVNIDTIHISQRGSYDHTGYYRCAASLSLP